MRLWRLLHTLDQLPYRLACIEQAQSHLNGKVEEIMTKQDELNAIVERLGAATEGLRSDIQAIKDEHPEVDLSALEARVAGLEGLDAEYPVAPPQEENPGLPPQE